MLKITLYAEQKKRHRFIEQSFRRSSWDSLMHAHDELISFSMALVTSDKVIILRMAF